MEPTKINIRPFEHRDTDQLKILMDELVIHEALTNKLRLEEPDPQYKDKYFQKTADKVNQGSGAIYVAEDAGKIVGYIIGIVNVLTEEDLLEFIPATEGFITDVFVAEDYRSRGIGTKLMDNILGYFSHKGCSYLKLYTQAGNVNAQNLYKKLGFETNNLKMIKLV